MLVVPHGHRAGRLRLPDPHRLPGRADGRTRWPRPCGRSPLRLRGLLHLPRAGAVVPDLTPAHATDHRRHFRRVAFLGGIYSNYLALAEALRIARRAAPTPSTPSATSARSARTPTGRSRSCATRRVPAIQGNYEESLSSGADDCHCGYTDPRDNHFAQISYDYTRATHERRAQGAGWARCPATSASPSAGGGCCSATARRGRSTSSCGGARRPRLHCRISD